MVMYNKIKYTLTFQDLALKKECKISQFFNIDCMLK